MFALPEVSLELIVDFICRLIFDEVFLIVFFSGLSWRQGYARL
jgi:hypothetical protein